METQISLYLMNIGKFDIENLFGRTITKIKKKIRKRNMCGIAFVGILKSFDCVDWFDIIKVFGILTSLGIEYSDRKVIHNLYKPDSCD